MKQEELIAKVKADEEASGKKNISLVVVGESDGLGSWNASDKPQATLTPVNPR